MGRQREVIRPPRVVGRRGAVLAYLAVVDVLYALSLWRPGGTQGQSATMLFIAGVMPLSWWAALWLSIAVLCTAGAFVHRFDRAAFAAAAGIKTLWGGTFLFGWIAGDVSRGWVSAVIWLGLAALVMILAGWPEPNAGDVPADDT
jgi:hypothetical protein